ncbi:MAG TPA: hypothetical protein VMR17_22275 [Xanthobacteraceae bacterium]|nr:hypothetical protein [Xanthobacteraceae bacterium]
MRGVAIVRLSVLALLLCTAAAAASAQDAGSPPATPQQSQPNAVTPVLPQNPLPGTAAPAAQQNPVPDPGTTGQAACIDETGDYETHGRTITFVIGLANKCDKRLKCTIDAYVVGAKGPASGHATLILGARSSGAAAKATYAMRVKAAGGTAQVSRECRVF